VPSVKRRRRDSFWDHWDYLTGQVDATTFHVSLVASFLSALGPLVTPTFRAWLIAAAVMAGLLKLMTLAAMATPRGRQEFPSEELGALSYTAVWVVYGAACIGGFFLHPGARWGMAIGVAASAAVLWVYTSVVQNERWYTRAWQAIEHRQYAEALEALAKAWVIGDGQERGTRVLSEWLARQQPTDGDTRLREAVRARCPFEDPPPPPSAPPEVRARWERQQQRAREARLREAEALLARGPRPGDLGGTVCPMCGARLVREQQVNGTEDMWMGDEGGPRLITRPTWRTVWRCPKCG